METIRYSLIGKQDLKLGTGTFEVQLADGRIIAMDEINVGKLLEQFPIQTSATVALLPTTGIAAGTLIRVSATETLYMYSGSAWSQVGGTGSHTHVMSEILSGILTVAMGGTGKDLSATVQGSVPYFSATGVVSVLAPGPVGALLMGQASAANPKFSEALAADGQLLIGKTGADPVAATLTQGTGITITNGAGAITIAAASSQNVNFVVRTSDSAARSSTTTLADDTVLLFAASASSVYYVEFILKGNSSSITPDFKVGLSVPAGTTYDMQTGPSTQGTTAAGSMVTTSDISPSVNGNVLIIFQGWVFTAGTAGNVTLQWCQNTSNAANLILKLGSFLRYSKLV